ncbi:MAG: response regulator transcription factor [Acidimicrobiia bacterium]|nr:response regulator transcription factor [Acidimicrobiia bacterium]
MTRILLVDDHEVVRQGLRSLIEREDDLEVVGEAGNAKEAVRRAGYDSPDLVILDVRLPDGSGVEVCRELRTRYPDLKIMMLTSHSDGDALRSAIKAGADGFILKQVDPGYIVDSIRQVAGGHPTIDPSLSGEIFRFMRGETDEDPTLTSMTEQERTILGLLGDGLSNREIADNVYLAEKTVKNYVSRILAKLDMSTRSEAAAFVARVRAGSAHRGDPEEWSRV